MSYAYAQKKRVPARQTGDLRFGGAEPDFPNSARLDALKSGASRPTAEDKGRRIELQNAMRSKMENAFGADFSNVKLYESQMVADAGAEAVTQGNEIAFAPGMADFSGSSGQALLGHELSHVALQSRGEVTGSGFLANSALEARADREGAMAARGEPVGGVGAKTYGGAAAPMTAASAAPMAGPMQAWKKKKPQKPAAPVDKIPAPVDEIPQEPVNDALFQNKPEDQVSKIDMMADQANQVAEMSDKDKEAYYNNLTHLSNFILNQGGMKKARMKIHPKMSDADLEKKFKGQVNTAKALRGFFNQSSDKTYGNTSIMGNDALKQQLQFVTQIESKRRNLSDSKKTISNKFFITHFGQFVKDKSIFGEETQKKPVDTIGPILPENERPTKSAATEQKPVPAAKGPAPILKEELEDKNFDINSLMEQSGKYDELNEEQREQYHKDLKHLANFGLNFGGLSKAGAKFGPHRTEKYIEENYADQKNMGKSLQNYYRLLEESKKDPAMFDTDYDVQFQKKVNIEKLQKNLRAAEQAERKRRNL